MFRIAAYLPLMLVALPLAAQPIRIGVVLNPSGKFYHIQGPIHNGIRLFFSDKDDVQLELITTDDTLAGQQAAAKTIQEKGIKFVIGHNFSSMAEIFLTSMPKDYDMTYVTPLATNLSLPKIRDGVFLVAPNNEMQISALFAFLKKQGVSSGKVVSVLNQTEPYAVEMGDLVARYAKTLDKVEPSTVHYLKDDKNLEAIVLSSLKQRPKILFLPAYSFELYNIYNIILPKLKDETHPPFILSGDSIGKEENLLEQLGPNAKLIKDSIYFTAAWDPAITTKVSRDFVAHYQAKFGEAPMSGAGNGYEASQLLYTAIKSVSKLEPKLVNAYLATSKHEGLTGKMAMLENHCLKRPVVLKKVTAKGYEYVGLY